MPSASAAQHRAMEAAAHGRSTLGIPAKVGEEFVAADWSKLDSAIDRAGILNARLDRLEKERNSGRL